MGARGDGVGPFDVQRDFQGPAGIGRRWAARGGFGENKIAVGIGGGEVKGLAEDAQVVGDVGGVVGIDDGDGLACAVGVDGVFAVAEDDVVEAIGVADFAGG